MEDINKIKKFISENTYSNLPKKYKLYKRTNNSLIEKTFLSFLKESNLGLEKVYNELIKKDCISVKKNIPFSGIMTLKKDSDEIKIMIKSSSGIKKYLTLIHELGHAQLAMNKKIIMQDYGETYPIFLELIFIDYFKKVNKKQALNLEIDMLNDVLNISSLACNYHNLNYSIESLVRIEAYKRFKGYLYAVYFYNMYLSNPEEAINGINTFIENQISFSDIIKSNPINKYKSKIKNEFN